MKTRTDLQSPLGSIERKRELSRAHYAANKEKYRDRARRNRINKPEERARISRQYYDSVRGRARCLFNAANSRAKNRNEKIGITVKWIEARLAKGTCEVSGLPFVLAERQDGYRSPYAPSLDRIDNNKGYTPENCRLILWALNMAFSNWGEDVYLRIAKSLVNRQAYDL